MVFWSKPKNGNTRISLKTRVPKTKKMKPKSCSTLKSSLFPLNLTMRKNIQMMTVLEVSMVDLCAAEAFLVTDTPKALKKAMEKQMAMLSPMRAGLAPKS